MTDEKNRERELFSAALDMAPEERAGFLREACRDDSLLYQRVLDLIEFDTIEDRILPTSAQNSFREGDLVEEPGMQLGRFKLHEKIGEGGMGIVYLAEQREPVVRKVALKIIKIGMDTKQVVARFEAERQTLAMMDHPNIAKVLDGGATETGRPYFVMELVQGLPITEFCDQNQLATEERLRLFARVCQAIQSAHQKGVIHRDIKPSNVLVSWKDGEAEPKVIDFGISKAIHNRLTEKTYFTQYGHLIGTPAYMSPEQAEMCDGDIDTRTDVYSLGVLLYELLTGLPPFSSKELIQAGYREMQRIILEEEPSKPSTRMLSMDRKRRTATAKSRRLDTDSLVERCRGDLDWIAMKCLEKARQERYETPSELVADIHRHLNSEPVSAAAPSMMYLVQKFARRHKAFVRSAAAITIILVLATVVSTTLAIWNNALREKAEASEQQTLKKSLELENNLYVSDMLAVEAAVEKEEFGRAEQLLRQHRIEPSGRDLRGLAWRFYWQRARGDWLYSLSAHEGMTFPDAQGRTAEGLIGILHFEMLHESERLLSRTNGEELHLWDLAKREPVHQWSIGGHFAVSPNEQYLCFVNADQGLTFWDLESNRLIRSEKQDERNRSWFQFTHDSRSIVVRTSVGLPIEKGRVHVEDVLTGEVVFTPDGYWFDVAASPAEPVFLTTGVVDPIMDLADSEQILRSSVGYVWDIERRERIPFTLPAQGRGGMGVQFSPKGTYVLLEHTDDPFNNSRDMGVRLFRVSNGERVADIRGVDFGGVNPFRPNTAAFSSDERYLAATPANVPLRRIGVWDLETGQQLAMNSDFADRLSALVFHPETDDLVVACSNDQTLLFWNWKEDRVVRRFKGHRTSISTLGVDRRNRYVVTGGGDGRLVFWPPVAVGGTNRLPSWIGGNAAVRFSGQGTYLLFGEYAEDVSPNRNVALPRNRLPAQRPVKQSVFLTESRERLLEVPRSEKAMGFSMDERHLITLTTNQILSREVRTGLVRPPVDLEEPILGEDFHRLSSRRQILSPDGTTLISVSPDQTLRLISVVTGQVLSTLGHRTRHRFLEFTPSGNRILFVTDSQNRGSVRAGVWNPAGDSIVWLEPDQEIPRIQRLVASPDGRFVAACGHDNQIWVWEMATGQRLTVIETNNPRVLFFTPDSQTLGALHEYRQGATRFMHSTLKLFDLRTFRQIGDLRPPLNSSWVSFSYGALLSPNAQALMFYNLFGERYTDLMSIPPLEEIDATGRRGSNE